VTSSTSPVHRLLQWLAAFWPARLPVDARERWRALLGAGCGVLFTALLCRWWVGSAPGAGAATWLVAPIGASAVLVFAAPASPLAQPWAVVGGTTLSALVGTLCALVVPDPAVAGAVAVAAAIGVMFWLRCLHPPGGAAALMVALTGAGAPFALFPVLANCVLLVAAGMLYNRLTGRAYPHVPAPSGPSANQTPSRFSPADLDAALAHYNQVIDVSRDQLETLLERAESASYQRRFGDLRCGDVMTAEPLSVLFGTPLEEAWRLMRQRRVKALPVTDRARRIVGIVTVADFLRHAGMDRPDGIAERLRGFVRATGTVHSEKPEVVGQIMTREVRVASVGRAARELIPLLSEAGHHHIPVIDGERRLVGVITQSDLIRALYLGG